MSPRVVPLQQPVSGLGRNEVQKEIERVSREMATVAVEAPANVTDVIAAHSARIQELSQALAKVPAEETAKSIRGKTVAGTPAQIDKLVEPGKYYITKSRQVPNPPAGFFVMVSKTGSKSFYIRLQIKDRETGLTRRKTDMALGRYPATTLTASAQAACDAAVGAARGEDPGVARRERKAAVAGTPTLREALDQYVTWTEREGKRTGKAQRSAILHLVDDRLHATKIGMISRDDIVPALKKMDRDGSPSSARNTASYLSSFLRFVEDKTEWKVGSWLGGYRRPAPVAARERTPSISQVRSIVSKSREAAAPWGNLIEFLALSGVRVGEAAGTRWDELDQNVWIIPSFRMKSGRAHVVPLTAAMSDVLERQRQVLEEKGREGSDFVFTTNGKQAVAGIGTKYYRPISGEFTPHDLRRGLRTALAEAGYDRDLGELILAHARAGVHGVYDRSERLDHRREALEWWAVQVS
ncbi:tyrosine-type recombinase/integrase [Shimia abyssi]|uniref:Site-specific recombinase XerD n=1 Tax=Shimia abyssi TaxID=1662395 RepID=A0A2P8EYL9_9RHOB|nr:site-specific integrase [Shimia abyssi]PSL14525.1 site-specific recombinase XerD [Shimia abyssi]